jgi:hypothetical protein
MLLHPLKDPVPPLLAARGRAILGLLDARPRFKDSIKDQASYNTLCQHGEEWMRRESKPLRFRDTKGRLAG